MPTLDPAIHIALAVAAMLYVLFRIGREPFKLLGRRLTGSLPLRPLGAEPWLAIGGAVSFVGIGVAALISRRVGYPVTAGGLLAVAYAGAHVTLDHHGAARAFIRRFWTEQGITVPAPLVQMRIIGAAMVLVGLIGAAVVLSAAFG